MGKPENIKNNQDFSEGDLVALKTGGPWLTVCSTPPGNDPAPDGWTWTVMWLDADPTNPRTPFYMLPLASLVGAPPSPNGD